ncbi:MAG: hypothetical protein GX606_02820 [Elusimicrobia bacterium]|nr:hypothetical protein [Elusimicrobiota bacterium]
MAGQEKDRRGRTISRRGFSVMEYILLFLVVVGGLVLMRHYLQNTVQGRFKDAGDMIGFGYQQ